jgi:dTDP-4-amino-4,6-dideoxygalactose transaminase
LATDHLLRDLVKNFKSTNIKYYTDVRFIENKKTNPKEIHKLLTISKKFNHWSNQGPLWNLLSKMYLDYFKNLKNKVVVPCANGGIGLAALINLHCIKNKKKLRWVVSSFGFANTNRAELFNAKIIDCDNDGLFSIKNLEKISINDYDGIIITNPFGSMNDYHNFSKWADANKKILLIDNAAGVNSDIPNLPYQSFSLHHTKPFGFGEGGLVVIPDSEKELFNKIIEYTPLSNLEKKYWVNNGKISDISCAYHIERLNSAKIWVPKYIKQTKRIINIAKEHDLIPLVSNFDINIPFMNLGFISKKRKIDINNFKNKSLAFGKYYQPLKNSGKAKKIYESIINIPTHPDMKKITNNELHNILDNGLRK